jgi:uncharacterized 2Fe-2S/4Fe-4S cluster protein (DUF4445 family)
MAEEDLPGMAHSEYSSLCYQVTVALTPPTLMDNSSDLTRLRNQLKKRLGAEAIDVDLRVMQKLAQVVREEWKVTATVIDLDNRCQVIDMEAASRALPCYGLAVDIGTTTVVAYLVDLSNGKIIGKLGSHNLQAQFGDDVISRMIWAEQPGGLTQLQKAVVETINSLADGLCQEARVEKEAIRLVAAAGNTVMTHFFLGMETRNVRREPYIPTAVTFPPVKAEELGLMVHPAARVLNFPAVASYVGGDIVAGVLSSGQGHSFSLKLFIDIGTNGEIVLGNQDWLIACACSAGPSFEGAGVTCGMRAQKGAIERLAIDLEADVVEVETIGNVRPIGICGSGLIDCIAEMLRVGVIDRSGRICLENHRRVRERQGEKEFVLTWEYKTKGGKEIVITEGDIQNIMRSKGAVFAGIQSLLKSLDMDLSAVDKIIIAGGFGNYINIGNAISIGLLPDLPAQKYKFVGNASVKGACMALTSRESHLLAEELGAKMTYLELSAGNLFMDEFVSALFLPHTDLGLFPSVAS